MHVVALMLGLLLLAAGSDTRADEDPEPRAALTDLARIKGTWKAAWQVSSRRRNKAPNPQLTYTFKGDKLTIDTGDSAPYTLNLKVIAKKPFTIETTSQGGPARPMLLKIEKGELIVVTRLKPKTSDSEEDIFGGEIVPVMVFTRQRK
jgi:uncharacterized protein (TIGR03067 family)